MVSGSLTLLTGFEPYFPKQPDLADRQLPQREVGCAIVRRTIKRCVAPSAREPTPTPPVKEAEMTQTFEDAGKLGKEFLDSSLTSFTNLSQGAQAIATEASDYSKKLFETGTATFEKLFAVKSIEKAIEIQTDYAKQAYEGFVAEATKMGELYADIAKNAYKPFETIIAKSK
jgi:hypothetical protein